jgi:ATP-dependent Zn protease
VTSRGAMRLRATAYHEAGHAVVASLLGVKFNTVSVVADETTLGRLVHGKWPSGFDVATDPVWTVRRRLEPRIQVSLAGVFAERRGTGRRHNWTGAKGDLYSADTYVAQCNGSARQESLYMAWLTECTKAIIAFRWPSIEKVAEQLLVRQSLTTSAVWTVING